MAKRDRRFLVGDCRGVLPRFSPNTFTAVVTDPPYGLKFMGKQWDHGVPGVEFWKRIRAVCKPGAPLLAFGGTRTYHRLTCAIEDAGWEIRDSIQWIYGSGFPKSHDIGKAIDKAAIVECPQCSGDGRARIEGEDVGDCLVCDGAGEIKGAEREVVGFSQQQQHTPGIGTAAYGDYHGQTGDITAPATPEAQLWDGWGTALKPAFEPIVLAMNPIDGTFAHNALTHGVAGLNVDGSRVGIGEPVPKFKRFGVSGFGNVGETYNRSQGDGVHHAGRWPPNVVLTHLPGCRKVGVRRVKTQSPSVPERNNLRYCQQDGKGRSGVMSRGYADADGLETVDAYECVEGCPVLELGRQSGEAGGGYRNPQTCIPNGLGMFAGGAYEGNTYSDTGTAARFFPQFHYCPKASKNERTCGGQVENKHPTVKPIALMEYLVRLVSMPVGTLILDPFCGSGSTLLACKKLGIKGVGIDSDPESVRIALQRLRHTQSDEDRRIQ